MSTKHKRITFGAILIIASTWSGAYVMHKSVAELSWMSFPAFVTATFVAIMGLVIMISSLDNL